jgi:hypothetical protein
MSTYANEVMRKIEKGGIKISKDKLIDALKKTGENEFYFASCPNSKYILIKLPLQK